MPACKRIIAWTGSISGAALSILGTAASTCVVCAPVCGTVCCGGATLLVSGVLVSLLGTGISLFLYKHSVYFISIGAILFVSGAIVLFVSKLRIQRGMKHSCCESSNTEGCHAQPGASCKDTRNERQKEL